jgi:hypothetical protein
MHLNTKEIEMTTFTNHLESWVGSGKFDNAGREIGYIVGLSDNGTEFAAWVQNGRKVNGKFADFGVRQRTKRFANQDQATSWGYRTAKERIAKL